MAARELRNAAIASAKDRMGHFEIQLLNAGEQDAEEAAEKEVAEKEAPRTDD